MQWSVQRAVSEEQDATGLKVVQSRETRSLGALRTDNQAAIRVSRKSQFTEVLADFVGFG